MKGQEISPWSFDLENSLNLDSSKITSPRRKEEKNVKLPNINNSIQSHRTPIEGHKKQSIEISSFQQKNCSKQQEFKINCQSNMKSSGPEKKFVLSQTDQTLFQKFVQNQEKSIILKVIQEHLRSNELEKIQVRSFSMQQNYQGRKQMIQDITSRARKITVNPPFPTVNLTRIHQSSSNFEDKLRNMLTKEAQKTIAKRMQFLWKNGGKIKGIKE